MRTKKVHPQKNYLPIAIVVIAALAVAGFWLEGYLKRAYPINDEAKEARPSNRWEIVGENKTGYIKFVLVKPEHQNDKSVYWAAGNSICGKLSHCGVMFWDAQRDVPEDLPLTSRQQYFKAADYFSNKTTGYLEMVWGCRFDASQCDK